MRRKEGEFDSRSSSSLQTSAFTFSISASVPGKSGGLRARANKLARHFDTCSATMIRSVSGSLCGRGFKVYSRVRLGVRVSGCGTKELGMFSRV